MRFLCLFVIAGRLMFTRFAQEFFFHYTRLNAFSFGQLATVHHGTSFAHTSKLLLFLCIASFLHSVPREGPLVSAIHQPYQLLFSFFLLVSPISYSFCSFSVCTHPFLRVIFFFLSSSWHLPTCRDPPTVGGWQASGQPDPTTITILHGH